MEGYSSNVLLSSDANMRRLESVGGHELIANTALSFGVVLGIARSLRDTRYNEATFDAFMLPVDDVTLEIRIRYQILEL